MKHAIVLINRLGVKNGDHILDLACGTGTLALELAKRVGENGEVVGIDFSAGMLNVANRKKDEIGIKNVKFSQSDMINGINGFSIGSFDSVCCGWAIGYVKPYLLLREIHRVLKEGGKVAIIENSRNSLAELRNVGIKVAKMYPKHIKAVMDLELRLPKNISHLRKMFVKSRFKPIELWDGKQEFHFKNGQDVLNWVLNTGASAGFDQMMDSSIRKECDEAFIKFIEESYLTKEGITVAHRFVGGIAKKV